MYLTNVQEFKRFHLKSKAGINEHQYLRTQHAQAFHGNTTIMSIRAKFKDYAFQVISFSETKNFCYLCSNSLTKENGTQQWHES